MAKERIDERAELMSCSLEVQGLVPTGPFLPYNDIVLYKDIVKCSSLVWNHRLLYPLGVDTEIGEGNHHLKSMYENKDYRAFTTQS